MIKMNNVSFSYGDKKVLDGFSLSLERGERLCLFGESGRGKTTVLRIIMGLEKANEGEVEIDSRSISAVFQEDRLLPFKTVYENIREFSDVDDIDSVLSELNLTEARDEYPSELSGGMARRTAIARALCKNSDIYIFDEAFTGLDEANITSAVGLINRMTEGKTVVTVLHSRSLAERLNCEIIEM